MNRQAFTLIEVLVAALILATAGLTAAGIYVRTAQKVQGSLAEAEAASLAETIRVWAPSNVSPGGSALSHTTVLPNPPTLRAGLVWRLDVEGIPAPGTTDVYKSILAIAQDDDANGRFDASDLTNAEVARFVFLLKDE